MTYTWNGPGGKGAMKQHRAKKRFEAEARQLKHTAKSDSAKALLLNIFEGGSDAGEEEVESTEESNQA